jgi:hypothetical protein
VREVADADSEVSAIENGLQDSETDSEQKSEDDATSVPERATSDSSNSDVKTRSRAVWSSDKSPPLWPVAAPAVLGLLAGLAGQTAWSRWIIDIAGIESNTWLWYNAPLFISVWIAVHLASSFVEMLPEESGEGSEVLAGFATVMLLGTLLQAVIGSICCLLFLVFFWVFISTYWWRLKLPPFRTGIWLGVGGLISMLFGVLLSSILFFPTA